MIRQSDTITEISDIIFLRIQTGFIPDIEALHFLKNSYGVNSDAEIAAFFDDTSLNDGTIYELIVYPDDELRNQIEQLIPAGGFSTSEITIINNRLLEKSPEITIKTDAGKYGLDPGDSSLLVTNYINRLNLDQDLQYIGHVTDASSAELYFRSRSLLRKKKFHPAGDRGSFIKSIIQYRGIVAIPAEDILKLIEKGISLLAGNKDKAFDELASKKYFFESVLSQAEEYSALLKTWGMEMLLMKRIQPSPVSAEEAIDSIRTIDRLTSLAYGLIIPPSDIAVHVRLSGDDAVSDIFR